MSEPQYYWPTVDGEHEIHHKDGYWTYCGLRDGLWSTGRGYFTHEGMLQEGYLGVRRDPEPIDEEKERERFEDVACKGPFDMARDSDGIYFSREVGFAWEMWLAAKRDERGCDG